MSSMQVDVLFALHAKKELHIETVNEAAKACSECWSVGRDDSREVVRAIGMVFLRLTTESDMVTERSQRLGSKGCWTKVDGLIRASGSIPLDILRLQSALCMTSTVPRNLTAV